MNISATNFSTFCGVTLSLLAATMPVFAQNSDIMRAHWSGNIGTGTFSSAEAACATYATPRNPFRRVEMITMQGKKYPYRAHCFYANSPANKPRVLDQHCEIPYNYRYVGYVAGVCLRRDLISNVIATGANNIKATNSTDIIVVINDGKATNITNFSSNDWIVVSSRQGYDILPNQGDIRGDTGTPVSSGGTTLRVRGTPQNTNLNFVDIVPQNFPKNRIIEIK
ncbi:hypothetical protein [Calothrix sp. 336/3]|uniref:hypothetical protein n=1 Tax=Calothrix sp. 336/3 TaxID=1337936 RepID=UPI0004E2F47C|nr:hypothetical protein [Calothrix sp. 336/3]AKG24923.1 hypothetical protein IJ00_26660 [Calothrix sp. 336/3]